VLLSESTLDLMTAPVDDLAFVDEITVRGSGAPTRVWGLAETATTPYASVPGGETV
jgi:hypothetical protein